MSMSLGSDLDLTNFSPGLREDGLIKTWVYFQNKDGSSNLELDNRRKNNRSNIGLSAEASFYDLAISPNYIDQLNGLGIHIINQSRWLNAVSVLVNPDQLYILNELTFVKKLAPVFQLHRKKPTLNGEISMPMINRDGDLDYGYAQDQIEQINVHTAHENGYYGQGVRVLVIDTGFDLSHSVFDSLTLIA